MSPEVQQAEARDALKRLELELSSRASVVHFAHSAVSMVLAIIFAGAAGKLSWDLKPAHLYLAAAVGLLAVGLTSYSVVRYVLGKRMLALELARYEQMKALRRSLQLDDPSALLPR